MRVEADSGLCKCGGKLRLIGTSLSDNIQYYICDECKQRMVTKNTKEVVLISSRTKE